MRICKKKPVDFSRSALWLLPALILTVVLAAGCSSYYAGVKKKTRELCRLNVFDDGFKKTVWVGFAGNQRLMENDAFGKVFEETFLSDLRSDSDHLRVLKQGELKSPLVIPRLETGCIDNFSLAAEGRRFGVNTFVFSGLTDICTQERVEGLPLLKDVRYYLQLHSFAEGYDTETGAKIFDESFLYEIEIEDSDVDYVQSRRWNDMPEVREALERAALELGEKVRDALFHQKWAGYIRSVSGDRVVISAGERSGLKAGDFLEVYDAGEIKEGIEGHRFLTVGLPAGKIQITSVGPDRSEGRVVSGRIEDCGGAVKPEP